mmetsp:Transcript_23885/g.38350  ORF Transcript_23885/g.38350 Transcript_23885/m.38350 type:complete len:102 (+) Transcript_23885:233-538(+)
MKLNPDDCVFLERKSCRFSYFLLFCVLCSTRKNDDDNDDEFMMIFDRCSMFPNVYMCMIHVRFLFYLFHFIFAGKMHCFQGSDSRAVYIFFGDLFGFDFIS